MLSEEKSKQVIETLCEICELKYKSNELLAQVRKALEFEFEKGLPPSIDEFMGYEDLLRAIGHVKSVTVKKVK